MFSKLSLTCSDQYRIQIDGFPIIATMHIRGVILEQFRECGGVSLPRKRKIPVFDITIAKIS